MDKYTPPYTISDRMLKVVSEISEKVGRINGREDLNARPHLRRNNRIRSIHSSLKIEANSLSLAEVRDVINGHPVIGDDKDIQEVKNAYAAYESISAVDPYSLSDLKKTHGIMTDHTVEESGKFRSCEEGVFSGDQCIFIAPPPQMVESLMANLMDWMREKSAEIHPLILSSVFHYEFVFIHPFSDGNGRMARLWQTILLAKWRDVFEYIPLESQIEKYQEGYYDAIAACHTQGKSDIFIDFMLDMINQVLDDTLARIGREKAETTEYVKRLLDVMEYDVPYTSNAIMSALGLKSKETLRKNYINPAIDLGLLRMTLPDKPNSRNQRYVKQ